MKQALWGILALMATLFIGGCNEEQPKEQVNKLMNQGMNQVEEGRKALEQGLNQAADARKTLEEGLGGQVDQGKQMLEETKQKAGNMFQDALNKSKDMAGQAGKSLEENKSFIDELLQKLKDIIGG